MSAHCGSSQPSLILLANRRLFILCTALRTILALRVLTLLVLALAMREVGDAERAAVLEDPMSAVLGLDFIGLVEIIDPLRPSAKEGVRLAHAAGIEVRMITGDHAATAAAIGEELGLGPGAISGAEFRALSDREVLDRLGQLHVFGRVSPQDKLRLVQLMQSTGQIVAMTGDAVNDAAALK